MLILWLVLMILAVLFVCGGYVFFSACYRRKETQWFNREAVERTPYGKYYDCILDADRWLKDHNAQDVTIISKDGLRLHGQWIPAENPIGTILLVHGYRSTKLVDFGVAFAYYHERNFNILAPEQRCHGQSEGRFITFGVKESEDMLRWIRFHNVEYGELPLFLSGLSMGASTVMYMADQELPRNVRGIIADCGFTTPKEIIARVYRHVTHLPAAPVMPAVDIFARLLAGFSLSQKDTRRSLHNAKVPVLLIHGRDDRFVPCHMSEESYSACGSKKNLLLVDGAGHGVSFLVAPDCYSQAVESFIAENLERDQ